MHGRIKTISTEEQKLKQLRNRQAKLEAYRAAYSIIQEKKKNKVFDNEVLVVTQDLLLSNPDIISLWNFRRECFLCKKTEVDEDTYQKLLNDDLLLTEMCLRVNPKSYGSWHHREWVLKEMPKCDWQKEVLLCNKYLSFDERNFHCWDYRRVVVENAKVPDKSEYDFTTEKIQSNFSNYSAWHYRSKLLPKIFPDLGGKFPVAENIHKEELELVQNAAFTDPDDQSAWFYQRWLLNLRQPQISIVQAYVTNKSLTISFSKGVKINDGAFLNITLDGNAVESKWTGTSDAVSSVWNGHLSQEVNDSTVISISLEIASATVRCAVDNVIIKVNEPLNRPPPLFISYSSDLVKTLNEQLQCCQQLLELEPDSKWTLLTCQLLMQFIDPAGYNADIIQHLKKLIDVDPIRSGYYQDMINKFRIEMFLRENWNMLSFNLSGLNLTSLVHTQYMVRVQSLDLSNNGLKAEALKHFHCLLQCEHINLNGNKICTLTSLPILNNLKKLTCEENPLTDKNGSIAYLKNFTLLSEILL